MTKIGLALLLPVMLAGCASVPLAVYPDSSLPPSFGTVAHSQTSAEALRMVGGGTIPASVVDSGCDGFIAAAPSLRVNNSTVTDTAPLHIWVVSADDATLLVRTPDGAWRCDDGSGGDVNPAIQINGPVAGLYDIWLGTLSSGESVTATLHLF